VRHSIKSQKFTKTPCFWISLSFKVIDVGTSGNVVSSAFYDKQFVCVCLQFFFMVDQFTVAETTHFEEGTHI